MYTHSCVYIYIEANVQVGVGYGGVLPCDFCWDALHVARRNTGSSGRMGLCWDIHSRFCSTSHNRGN